MCVITSSSFYKAHACRNLSQISRYIMYIRIVLHARNRLCYRYKNTKRNRVLLHSSSRRRGVHEIIGPTLTIINNYSVLNTDIQIVYELRRAIKLYGSGFATYSCKRYRKLYAHVTWNILVHDSTLVCRPADNSSSFVSSSPNYDIWHSKTVYGLASFGFR